MHSCSKLTLLLIAFTCLHLCHAKPTFGNEYVHIKVHVPKEITHKHIYHEPDFHAPIVPAKKVIHHYHHRRRRPSKQHKLKQQLHNEHDALLGSIVLSDVKSPITGDHLEYLQHVNDIANHLAKPTIKDEHTKINTYRVIEETKLAPAALDEQDSHQSWKKPTVETIKIIDSKPKPVNTYKIIETKQPQYDQYEDYPHKSKVHADSYKPTTHIEYETHTQGDSHYYAHKPHTKTVKIVETSAPIEHTHHGQHQHFATAPERETITVTETKALKPASYHHKRPYADDYVRARPALEYGAPARPSYDDAYSGRYTDGYQQTANTYLPPITDAYLPPKEGYTPPKDTYLPPPPPAPPRDVYLPPDKTYLPAKKHADYHQVGQSSTYDDDYRASVGSQAVRASDDDVGANFLTPIVAGGLDGYGYGHSTVDTYTGIDSYTAKHVQGLGSGGYSYA